MLVGLLVCKPHELFNMSAINPTKKTLEINQLGQQLDTTRTVLGIRTIGRSIPGKTLTDLHFELKREPKKISQGWLFPYLSRKKKHSFSHFHCPWISHVFLGDWTRQPIGSKLSHSPCSCLTACDRISWRPTSGSHGPWHGEHSGICLWTESWNYHEISHYVCAYTIYLYTVYIHLILCVFVCASIRSIGSSSLFQCRFLFLGVPIVRHTQV